MTDLATLGIRVESEEAARAADNLDDLSRASDRAEKQTDDLARAARRADGAVETMNVAVRQQTAVLAASRAGMGLTAAEGLNLSRQMTDVGVQMAMGMNPFLIAVQQGPQIFDAFQMAAIRTGTTVSAAMAATGRAVWVALAPLLPLIAGIGAAAGVIWGGWSLTTRALTKDIGDLTAGMGLSEEQMKRLAETGTVTTATAGDAFRGLGTTIKEMFQEAFGPQLDWVSARWNDAMDWITRAAGGAVKGFIAGWVSGFRIVATTWRQFPAIIGDAAFTAVNAVVGGIEGMVNAGIDGINALLAAARKLGPLTPLGAAANAVGDVRRVRFGRFSNPFQGAMGQFSTDVSEAQAYGGRVADAIVDGFMDRWRANTRASGQARVLAAAGEADAADRASGARGARAATQEVIPLTRENPFANDRPLRDQIGAYVSQLELVADELRLIDGLARDVGRGLASAFGDGGRALGELLTVTTGYQSRLAEIALAEEQHRLTGAQAARERSQAEIGAYGDMAAAAKGFFKEGSDGYQILQAAEQAFRLVQLAGMLQSMMVDNQTTGSAIANSLARGAANAAEGASKMFAMLGPYAFPVVAAMTALLLSMGIRSGGGRSSGGGGGTFNPGPINDGSAQRAQLASGGGMGGRQQVAVVVTTNDERFNAFVDERTQPYTDTRTAQGVSASRQASSADRRRSDRMRFGGRPG